jgi:FRG domain
MRKIDYDVWSFLSGQRTIQRTKVSFVRRDRGQLVRTFPELIERVAQLSFRNPEFVLFYRGQAQDFPNRNGASSLYPSIFRSPTNYLQQAEVERRFQRLLRAEDLLNELYDLEGTRRIRIYQILRWAILQHYEICATPLLDVTQSLRVACSFAQQQTKSGALIYILGLPQISGSVTASSEHGIQIIRLLSICPPSALRPHFQEGFLLGEYPTISFKTKAEYDRNEFDFGQRLLCKFRLGRKTAFWTKDFPVISQRALYPDALVDRLNRLAQSIKAQL